MDITFLIVVLAMVTLLGGVVFALVSKEKVDARLRDPDSPKSTLAADGSPHGRPTDI